MNKSQYVPLSQVRDVQYFEMSAERIQVGDGRNIFIISVYAGINGDYNSAGRFGARN
jgi:hypothetical protein